MKPFPTNFCSGNFKDWMEVFLTSKCQGRCAWCVEHGGFRPSTEISWEELADVIIASGKKNIILLGGEPTLYPHLQPLLEKLYHHDLKVYITTNGGTLTPKFVEEKLSTLTGINISLHHYNLFYNRTITGIMLKRLVFAETIDVANQYGITVRLNCNIIKGYIDNKKDILRYISFAKVMGANSIRFAELKTDTKDFVSLADIFNYEHGLNENPFTLGCSKDTIIDGMSVNFRQMCGLQTPYRDAPIDPEQDCKKNVLYYDGVIYDGWQRAGRENDIKRLLQQVNRKNILPDEAIEQIKEITNVG